MNGSGPRSKAVEPIFKLDLSKNIPTLFLVEYGNSIRLQTSKDKNYRNWLNLLPLPKTIACTENQVPYLEQSRPKFLPANFDTVMLIECCIYPNIEKANAFGGSAIDFLGKLTAILQTY